MILMMHELLGLPTKHHSKTSKQLLQIHQTTIHHCRKTGCWKKSNDYNKNSISSSIPYISAPTTTHPKHHLKFHNYHPHHQHPQIKSSLHQSLHISLAVGFFAATVAHSQTKAILPDISERSEAEVPS
ncbi:hypothetical protein D6D02_05408 [Aureobasidium pullulans]|nr:hypothetical protein D6D02_05408 [Aureobasidium pullulans]